ncbi:MAG: DUF4870 domain-containing protein [Planctomycetota bacterium]
MLDDPTPPIESPDNGMSKEERELGMICHLLGFCGFTGIPFGHLLGPLVLWLIKKDEFAFVNEQGKEAVNFQITTSIVGIIAIVISIPLALTGIGLCLAIPLMLTLTIVWIVFMVQAAMASNKGLPYRYPICIRFIS